MATAELKGKVTLNTGQFNRGLRGLRRGVRRFSREFGRPFAQATASIIKLGVVALGIAAIRLGLGIKRAADFGDQIDKMSKRTGLSTQALSELSFAAELAGTNIEDLEKAVRTMQARILDLGLGLSTAVDAFKILGVSLEDVAGKTPEQQLDILLEALAGIEDATLRAAVAQRVFGRAGTRLLPILSGGVKALKAAREEANRFKKVTIHTLGFEGVKVSFMKALARKHGGTYSPIK